MKKINNEIFLYERNVSKNANLNIWLAYPSIYSFGMSSLGFLSIFKMFDEKKEYFIERIFTDTKETQLMVNQVDLIGFSISFEIDFLSVFKILEKYNYPLKTKDRLGINTLIFAGGPVLTSNPEPFAEIFDFIIIGDGEKINLKVAQILEENKNLSKIEKLKKLSEIDGIYVPELTIYDKKNKKVKTLDGIELKVNKITEELTKCIATSILSDKSYFASTYIIELTRGCPQKCGFCLASYLNLPNRYPPYEEIIKSIDKGLEYTNKIAFLGALVSAHPQFDKICNYIADKIKANKEIELSISSLRVDSINENLVKTLILAGQKHATIAIEAGSDRLRKVINKNLKEQQILEAVKIASINGLKGFKVYAMIGLPTETDEDIEELVKLAKKMQGIDKSFDLTFSFSTFVPKANTPFMFASRENTKNLERKYEYLKKEFHKLGIKIRCSSVKWDDIQALISKADRSFSDYLIDVYKTKGNLGSFKKAYKNFAEENSLPTLSEYLETKVNIEANFPYDFINIYPGKDYLKKEYTRLMSNFKLSV